MQIERVGDRRKGARGIWGKALEGLLGEPKREGKLSYVEADWRATSLGWGEALVKAQNALRSFVKSRKGRAEYVVLCDAYADDRLYVGKADGERMLYVLED